MHRFGVGNIDCIEDAVQWSMAQAVTHWTLGREPQNPPAWLYSVARRHLLSELRTNKRHQEILNNQMVSENIEMESHPDAALANELNDSLLRMLFLACDEDIPIESQLVFTLKTLCGFSIAEVGARLFISEANVYKRFTRAKQRLMKQNIKMDSISQIQVTARLSAVHKVLYLLFTEGYLSTHPDMMIRKDLCEEATRLTAMLTQHPWTNVPQSYALIALMLFNSARLETRENHAGLVLLEHQERRLWDQQKIAQALVFLNQSTGSDAISRYHIEAGIAAEHCLAKSYQDTRWDKIIEAYQLLEKVAPSPMHGLNLALAVAESKGPVNGLKVLESMDMPSWLQRSYHWYAVLADLQFRAKRNVIAKQNALAAIELAPTQGIKNALKKRMAIYDILM